MKINYYKKKKLLTFYFNHILEMIQFERAKQFGKQFEDLYNKVFL